MFVNQTYAPGLIEVLRATVQHMEQTSQVDQDNKPPAQLRTILNRRVADLERTMASEFVEALSKPISQDSHEECDWQIVS